MELADVVLQHTCGYGGTKDCSTECPACAQKKIIKWLDSILMSHNCYNLRGQNVTYRVIVEGDYVALLEAVGLNR